MKIRNTHDTLKREALSHPDVKAEYNALVDEFSLLEELIKARTKDEKTQEDVAKAMGTTTSSVGRLEIGGGKQQHSPTIATLRKYAQAVNHKLIIKLHPNKRKIS